MQTPCSAVSRRTILKGLAATSLLLWPTSRSSASRPVGESQAESAPSHRHLVGVL